MFNYFKNKYFDKYLYSVKVVRSGIMGEITEYYRPQKKKYPIIKEKPKSDFVSSRQASLFDIKRVKQIQPRLWRSIVRTKRNFRRLVWSNSDLKFLWTLTFKENVLDSYIAHQYFRNFIKRCRRRFGRDFKYISVFETQKRGAIHYHMLTNKWLDKVEDLDQLWNQGSVATRAEFVRDNCAVAEYLIKYLSKSFVDNFLPGTRLYFFSRNISRFLEYFRLTFDFSETLVLKSQKCYNKYIGFFDKYLVKFLC